MAILFFAFKAARQLSSLSLVCSSLLICFFTGPASAAPPTSNGESATDYPEFKQFLSPLFIPIKLIKFQRPGALYLMNGKPLTNSVCFLASIQTNTYYLEQCHGFFNPGRPAVSGASYSDFWYVDDHAQANAESRNEHISGTNTPLSDIIATRADSLDGILDLGILGFDRQTAHWTGNSFTSYSSDTNLGKITGQIDAGNGVRVERLSYSLSRINRAHYTVFYHYDNDGRRPVWMPHQIVLKISITGRGTRNLTNTIDELVVGAASLGKNGYDYEEFLARGENPADGNLTVYSNGVGRVRIGDHFEVIENPGKNAIPALFRPRRHLIARCVFLGILALSVGGFGWYAARRYGKNKMN